MTLNDEANAMPLGNHYDDDHDANNEDYCDEEQGKVWILDTYKCPFPI